MNNTRDLKAIGQRIKSIRLNKGMTLEEFGKLFNASKGSVQGWEIGRNAPNAERIKAIAKIGDISVDELLRGDIEYRLKILSEKVFNEYIKNKTSIKINDIKKNRVEKAMNQAANAALNMYKEGRRYDDAYIALLKEAIDIEDLKSFSSNFIFLLNCHRSFTNLLEDFKNFKIEYPFPDDKDPTDNKVVEEVFNQLQQLDLYIQEKVLPKYYR